MKNYRTQNGCHNCRYALIEAEFHAPLLYFCEFEWQMPPYPSTLGVSSEQSAIDYELYIQQRIERNVEPYSICDDWKACEKYKEKS